jgi:hypothetical protein
MSLDHCRVRSGARRGGARRLVRLDAVKARGFHPETVAMDRGYDNNRVCAECHDRGIAPVIPLRKGRIQPETPIKRGTSEWATAAAPPSSASSAA